MGNRGAAVGVTVYYECAAAAVAEEVFQRLNSRSHQLGAVRGKIISASNKPQVRGPSGSRPQTGRPLGRTTGLMKPSKRSSIAQCSQPSGSIQIPGISSSPSPLLALLWADALANRPAARAANRNNILASTATRKQNKCLPFTSRDISGQGQRSRCAPILRQFCGQRLQHKSF